jgi:glycosyltransferase involved in cell wall biosynthesis
MRIGFYAPFKPLDHPNPSGDQVIAAGLVQYLTAKGHRIRVLSLLRTRWIYWKPWNLFRAMLEKRRVDGELADRPLDLWLTYHSYYKAPDLLGPPICRARNIPYVIFQGIYSTRVRRHWRSRPGYHLNRNALLAADLVLTNRRDDLVNLRRLLPDDRLGYLAPGIHPDRFVRDPAARAEMRSQWRAGSRPVIIAAAMFRPDVKTQGLVWVIESCARLRGEGLDFLLVIAGDGRERKRLERLAARMLGERVVFAGRLPREEMPGLYSGGDLFVFPGINESLGMVYLEAQSCGLPVVAFANGGIPEVVRHRETGLLVPMYDEEQFDRSVAHLLRDRAARTRMGEDAARYIRECHDLGKNYLFLEEMLNRAVTKHKRGYAA